jgi:tousled-like kinase
VHRAYDLHEMKEVALKIHAVDCKVAHEQHEYVRRAIREVTIQEALQHPRVVSMHHVFQIDDNSFAIVMEACRGARSLCGFQHTVVALAAALHWW